MKHLLAIAGLAAASILLMAGDKSVRRPVVGVFTSVKGTVTIHKVGKTEGKSVRVGYALREGDWAELAADAAIEVMVKDKCKIVAASGAMKVKAVDGDVRKDDGSELDHKAMTPCLSKVAASAIAHDSSRVSGVIRMRPGKIRNAGPTKMKVCTTKPRIVWCVDEVGEGHKVRVRVTGTSGESVLDETVDGTEMAWPEAAGALTPGERYMVRYDLSNGEGKRVGATRFSMVVASTDELGVLETQSASPIVAAMYSEDFKCGRFALDTYRMLSADDKSGDDPPEALTERIDLLEPEFGCNKK